MLPVTVEWVGTVLFIQEQAQTLRKLVFTVLLLFSELSLIVGLVESSYYTIKFSLGVPLSLRKENRFTPVIKIGS